MALIVATGVAPFEAGEAKAPWTTMLSGAAGGSSYEYVTGRGTQTTQARVVAGPA